MRTNTTRAQWLARASGLAATAGALAILLSDAIRTGHWELEHALLPIVVGITITSGHLIGSALREWRVLSAIGFVALFALGTLATVYNSVGRQAATADHAALTADDHNAARASIERDLVATRKKLSDAEFYVAWEIAGRPRDKSGTPTLTGKPTGTTGCGAGCNGWQKQADKYSDEITRLEARRAALGPAAITSPKADRAAKVAALFGFERDRTKETFHLIEPFIYALLFELAAIVAFGYGFAHRATRKPSVSDSRQTSFPSITLETVALPANDETPPVPPKPGNRRPVSTKAAAQADIIQLVTRRETIPSQDTLANRWGVAKGTVSKWLADFERRGLIQRETVGRCKMVAAA